MLIFIFVFKFKLCVDRTDIKIKRAFRGSAVIVQLQRVYKTPGFMNCL